MSSTGFRCGLSGVMLQVASIPVFLHGHGLFAALLASMGLSLTYLGLKSMALSKDALAFDDSYRHLIVSLIAYSLVTAFVSTIFFGSGASLQTFALITVPVTAGSQVLYFLSYGTLTCLRSVDVSFMCRILRVLGIATSLVASVQLVLYVISPEILNSPSSLWFLLLFLTLFAGVKGLELVTWVKLRHVVSGSLRLKSLLLIASVTLLLIGASGVAAENVNVVQQVMGPNQAVGLDQQIKGVVPVREVIKVYATEPALLTLTQHSINSLSTQAEVTKYVPVNPPYQAIVAKGCPMVWLWTRYPVVSVGEADISLGYVSVNEYVYNPERLTQVSVDEEVTHELRITLLNDTMAKEFKPIRLSITYSTAGYVASQAPSLEVITNGKTRTINLPATGTNASNIYVPVNSSFEIDLIVPPLKSVEGTYVIKYSIMVEGQPKMRGTTHVTCKCLGSPILTPALPPYPLLSSEALNSNLILIPYPSLILVIGLAAIISYKLTYREREKVQADPPDNRGMRGSEDENWKT